MDNHEEISINLARRIPKDQFDAIMAGPASMEIDPEFLGFVGIYEAISRIIPKHFTIVDLGCAYAPQCFYFEKHKGYIGVDCGDNGRFKGSNTTHYDGTIQKFIEDEQEKILGPCFAICSYVPMWHGLNKNIIAAAFEDMFIYYPKRDDIDPLFWRDSE